MAKKFKKGDKIQVTNPNTKHHLKYGIVTKNESRGFVDISIKGEPFTVVPSDIQKV